jgi:dihydrolipoamide dehydrogenase
MVMGELVQETEVLVIGSGPGGYAAAFRAADLGFDVTMVDPSPRPGGVCLFQGCIPSKSLLHLSELIIDTTTTQHMGVTFSPPEIDINAIRSWKEQVITNMASGLETLSRGRSIQLLQGTVKFENNTTARLSDCDIRRITFQYAIIATGSSPIPFPGKEFATSNRIMSSTEALELKDIPSKLLIIGGGYVGLELGTVYSALGSQVDLVELGPHLLPGVDRDLVEPLAKKLHTLFSDMHFNTEVIELNDTGSEVIVSLKKENGQIDESSYDRILVAIGRTPNTQNLGLENTGVTLDNKGFIIINDRQQTEVSTIFAAGDVTGGMMLAHKATREGKVAAEILADRPSAFDNRAIPAIVYTDPQIGWCGISEEQAKNQELDVKILRFPWKYSGRAATMGATEGLTKLITDPESGRVLGFGITGRDTEGLIAEGVLAIEMGAVAEDLSLIIHPHPTLSETEGEAAELFTGSATHLLNKQK